MSSSSFSSSFFFLFFFFSFGGRGRGFELSFRPRWCAVDLGCCLTVLGRDRHFARVEFFVWYMQSDVNWLGLVHPIHVCVLFISTGRGLTPVLTHTILVVSVIAGSCNLSGRAHPRPRARVTRAVAPSFLFSPILSVTLVVCAGTCSCRTTFTRSCWHGVALQDVMVFGLIPLLAVLQSL